MNANFDRALPEILRHEGGFVNHPKDPGGATNKGITIGTLRRLGIDVDGDGDSDIADLKGLRHEHVARVYKLFYWDAVKADLLPSGVDYTVADFAVNSGPGRAAKHLQRALGVAQDGSIGPKTLAAAAEADPVAVISAIHGSRMRFLQGLPIWPTFKGGWTRRVDEVRAKSLAMAASPSRPVAVSPPPVSGVKPDRPRPRLVPAPAPAPAQPTPPKRNATGAVIAAALAAIAALVAGGWAKLMELFN